MHGEIITSFPFACAASRARRRARATFGLARLRKLAARAALIVFAVAALQIHAAVDLGQYTFTTKSLSASSVASGASFGNVSKTGTPVLAPQDTLLEVNNWSLAYNAGNYIEYTLAPTSGHRLNLAYVVYDAWKHEAAAPSTLSVELFLNSVSQGYETYTLPSSETAHTFNFTDFTASSGDTVHVRFYAYGGTATDKVVSFDNLQTWGDVTPVPEPVNLALACGSLAFIGVASSRRAWLWMRMRQLR
jgi:hypothetical protein